MATSYRGLTESGVAGLGSIDTPSAFLVLERILSGSAVQVGVLPANWSKFPAGAPSLVNDLMRQEASHAADNSGASELRRSLLEAPPGERRAMLDQYLLEQLAKVLRTSPSGIDLDQPLSSFGVDSLMGVELRTKIQMDLRMVVPIASILTAPSLRHIGTVLAEQLSAQWIANKEIESDAGQWEVLTI